MTKLITLDGWEEGQEEVVEKLLRDRTTIQRGLHAVETLLGDIEVALICRSPGINDDLEDALDNRSLGYEFGGNHYRLNASTVSTITQKELYELLALDMIQYVRVRKM